MRRVQAAAAVLIVVFLVGGAAYAAREVEPATPEPAATSPTPSGAWFCPHGGGEQDWEVAIQIANPGPGPATVRIRSLGTGKPEPPVTETIEPGSLAVVPVDAVGRERSSMVEWFGQWIAVGWISHAGGEEGGLAAEPCSPTAGGRWLVPDGTTAEEENDDYVVVMNPTARDAVVSFTLLSERRDPIQKSELTDVVLKPFHSTVVRLSDVVKGEDTVATMVEAATGRVVAAALGITTTGGVRSSLGYPGDPPTDLVFPGGEDAGRTQLAVMSTGTDRVPLTADLLGAEAESEQPLAGVADAAPPSRSARTFAATTAGPASVLFHADGSGVAATRRTFGVVSDQGSSVGGTPSAAWIVMPAVSGTPSHPGLAIANPGAEPVEVTLTAVGSTAEPASLTIAPRTSVLAPAPFLESHPDDAIMVVAESGSFVPASASYSRGKEGFATFAVALGMPIPAAWVPS